MIYICITSACQPTGMHCVQLSKSFLSMKHKGKERSSSPDSRLQSQKPCHCDHRVAWHPCLIQVTCL